MAAGTLPHSLEAEHLVLGSVFLEPKVLCDLQARLDAGDFYHPINRAMYAAMIACDLTKRPVDTLTVATEMKRVNRDIFKIVGEGYIGELISGVTTIANLGYHVKQIMDLARLRRLIEAASGIAMRGYDVRGDVGAFVEEAEAELSGAVGAPRETEYHTMHDVMKRTVSSVEKKAASKHRIAIPWGFKDLDNLTLGSEMGDLVFVGGRAKMGKTLVSMSSVERIALSTDAIPQLIISLEMGDVQLGQRSIASVGGIDAKRIRDAKSLTSADWVAFSNATSRLASAPIWCYAQPATMAQIKSLVRRWRMRETDKKRPARVVLDYLGRIKSVGRMHNENREEEIASWTNALKDLAVEEQIALTCLAQINRAVEQESDRRPQMIHLRGSGAIEADADQIVLIYRDDYYFPDSDDAGIIEAAVVAHRNGPTGSVALGCDLSQMRVFDLNKAAVEAWQDRKAPNRQRHATRKKQTPPNYTEPSSASEGD